jgi:hypothetical protein
MTNRKAGALSILIAVMGHICSAHAQLTIRVVSDAEQNTAMGSYAMGIFNSTFTNYLDNTAAGDSAMHTVPGVQSSALGAYALEGTTNSTGNELSTAVGSHSLCVVSPIGGNNTAVGAYSGASTTTGFSNTAIGRDALYSNTTGSDNLAVGMYAMYGTSPASGSYNTAVGFNALYDDSTGANNTAVGFGALQHNTTGSNNIAIGNGAGSNLSTGSYNIDLGNTGVAGESGVIRIGSSPNETAAYISGISTTTLTGAAVYVTSTGQLGVVASSERYKTAIKPLGGDANRIAELRPVSFHLKSEPKGVVQYGLIAEEVEKVYPQLVTRDEAGEIQGVRYDELDPLLLDNVQQHETKMKQQDLQIEELRNRVLQLIHKNQERQAAIANLEARLEARYELASTH